MLMRLTVISSEVATATVRSISVELLWAGVEVSLFITIDRFSSEVEISEASSRTELESVTGAAVDALPAMSCIVPALASVADILSFREGLRSVTAFVGMQETSKRSFASISCWRRISGRSRMRGRRKGFTY